MNQPLNPPSSSQLKALHPRAARLALERQLLKEPIPALETPELAKLFEQFWPAESAPPLSPAALELIVSFGHEANLREQIVNQLLETL